ncbi:MAG: thiolase domain-containing protein [Deltaproteobacteria bacterium]|nr:thiolase domain-containing protein [Deltaproteobacteria bacterium]
MREVAVIGTGMNKWGELWEKSLRDIFVEAALKAIDNSGIDKIDSMYVGCMTSGLFVGQEHLASLLSDYLGYGPIPTCRVESACASGGLAIRQGIIDVASGVSDIVLVGGIEKMNDVDGGGATDALATASDQEWEAFNGITFPGIYALMARAHMEKYGTTRDQLSHVSVKNHNNGLLNPNAQFKLKATLESVKNAVMVATPLTLMDCSPVTDGAAAVVLCSLDTAKKMGKTPLVVLKGMGHATNSIALHTRKDLTTIESTTMAAQQAYKMAGVGPKDINFAEVHDCFTIAEIMATESLGFFERGEGGKAAESGITALGGKMPINTSGGLKSKGHPVGATGVAQVCEVVSQLKGCAGDRQLKNPRRGLTHNMGGSGGSSLVHIWEVL